MMFTKSLSFLLIATSIYITTSCGPTKQEQRELLNQKIERLNELVVEQKSNKEKRHKQHSSVRDSFLKEFEYRMNANFQKNKYDGTAHLRGMKSITDWMDKVNDSLDQVYLKDSIFFNQNKKTIDSLEEEITKYKSELDLLLGIK